MRLYSKSKSALSNDNGIALPLVLMVMLLLIIFGVVAYNASQSSLLQASQLHPSLQAKYLARSAVDATVAAWTDEWVNNPDKAPTYAHFYTKYDVANDNFVTATASEAGKDNVIETKQVYNPDIGKCTITANATVNGKSATVTAVSEGLVTENSSLLSTPWYSYEYTFLAWSHIAIPNPDSSKYVTDKHGKNYYASYHHVDGIVNLEIKRSGTTRTLYLDERETDYTVIGYQAKRIIFNSPLDLYTKGSLLAVIHPQMLVVSAETIDFNKTITIGDSAHGNLTLHLPSGLGISGEKVYHAVSSANKDKVKLDASYGLVRFSGVNIRGSLISSGQPNDPKYIQNKTFYFRHPDDDDALNIGTEPSTLNLLRDLLGWTNTANDFRFKTLLDKGYLIPAPDGISLKSDYDVLFVYQ